MPLAARGEFAQVDRNMDQAVTKAGQPVKRGTMAHEHDVTMLQVESAVQRRDRAILPGLVSRLEELSRRDDHRLYLAIAHRAWGVAHHLAGELDEAEARLAQALEIFADLETRWQAGRTLYEFGELAMSRDDPDAARGYFEKALDSFEALGALPDVERARRMLAGNGWIAPGQLRPSRN